VTEGVQRPRFFGAYAHTLDPKGRITLPARFRTFFEDRCFITPSQYGDPCLVIWTPQDYEAFTAKINPDSWDDAATRLRLRSWLKGTFEVEIDRTGRMPVPAPLRQSASLVKEVSVQGVLERIELWDPSVWESYSAQESSIEREGR
jgi:MraZ protein